MGSLCACKVPVGQPGLSCGQLASQQRLHGLHHAGSLSGRMSLGSNFLVGEGKSSVNIGFFPVNLSTAKLHPLNSRCITRAAVNPAFPFPSFPLRFPFPRTTSPSDTPPRKAQPQQDRQLKTPAKKGSWTSSRSLQSSAKFKDESELSYDRPLPLPMAYPDSKPLSAAAVEEMLACDPEVVDCKGVVYQWTDKCGRCAGSGFVSFRRGKRKHDVTATCLACTGIGYVQRFTVRDDIPLMEDIDQS